MLKMANFLLFFVIIFSFVVSVLWLFGFLTANDLTIPQKRIHEITQKYKTILVVFPHADDEFFTVGGLMSRMASSNTNVYWAVITQGGKGNPTGIDDPQLRKIRVEEARRAGKVYGVKKILQMNYPDGAVDKHIPELQKDLRTVLQKIKPDLVITYDLSGLYGHPDHIVTSRILTTLLQCEFKKTTVWYASFPMKLMKKIQFPTHMAKDKTFADNRSTPSFRVWVGLRGVLNKIKAVYIYKSQAPFSKSRPIKILPVWFYISFTPYEYFYETE